MTRRQTDEAGYSWRKQYVAKVRLKPWIEFRAGVVGFWLICAAVGAMLAVVARGA